METRQLAPACPGGTIYTIRAGDTYFSLAGRFNTTVDAITAANPDVDPDELEVGQEICIPVAPVPGPCTNGTIYTIRAGDTLFSLANRFNTSVGAILDANPGLDPESLQVGRRICIPAVAPSPTCPGRTYTIRSGDTLLGIAQRFGFTLRALLAANPGINPRQLMVGQVICLPSAPGPVTCPGGRIYVIRAGDTLFSIANRFRVTQSQLLTANPQITDPDVITVGQSICIPGGTRFDDEELLRSKENTEICFPYNGIMGPCPFSPYHMCMYSHHCFMISQSY